MKKQLQTLSFIPPINLVEECKWLLAVSSFEATNSVFNIINENNSFSIFIPGHWHSESAEKTIGELNKMLELNSQSSIELHVKEVRERGSQIKIGDKEYNLSDFVIIKKRTEELKDIKINDLEDMVFRMELTYNENIDVLDLN